MPQQPQVHEGRKRGNRRSLRKVLCQERLVRQYPLPEQEKHQGKADSAVDRRHCGSRGHLVDIRHIIHETVIF